VWALLHAGAARVSVWNRTPDRARALAGELGATVAERPAGADLLVNCTAVGLDGNDPFDRLPLTAGALTEYGCVVDFVYTDSGTVLTREAAQRGVPIVDGMALLIGQGALSFQAFTGRPASTAAMRAAVAAH
jgi:shikimate dehydrogenase